MLLCIDFFSQIMNLEEMMKEESDQNFDKNLGIIKVNMTEDVQISIYKNFK